ncbi:MAG TPA: alkaline phosphatase D family protein, partial [Acidimicrobiia bacterium]|nr:alkaline phosphatase D family protein [Acidimicrobiia bacterium]
GDDMPIYQAFTIGRIRVVMTDLRSARSDRTIVGDEQWRWLNGQLQAAASLGEVVLWVNTVPWITAEDRTSDHWGAFAEERMAISTLIDIIGVDVVMLGGDAHMVAIDDGTNSAYGHEPPGIVVFHAGALDRPGSLKGGPYSHGAVPGGGQFGLVEVRDDGTTIELRLTGLDWEGRVLVEHEVAFR